MPKNSVHAVSVDERDSGWEVDTPPFRVFLWRRPSVQRETAQEDAGYELHVYELTGVDVHTAIRWAEEHAGTDRTYTLFVCHTNHDGQMGMLRLAGIEPTHPPGDSAYFGFRARP